MRKMMLLAAMVAIAALMLAATPALAQDSNEDGFDDFIEEFCEDFDGDGIEDCEEFFEEFCEDLDGDFFCDEDEEDNFCDFFDCHEDNSNNVPAITQDFEQEAESGYINQSFDVSNTGDNSNQTVGIQGVANTGNAQNQIGVVDAGNFGDFDGNHDGDERFFFVDDFCDFGDWDGDGICDRLDRLQDRFEDLCQGGEVDEDNDGICDRLDDRIDRLEERIDDDGFFFVADDFNNGDNGFFFGGDEGGDFEFEDVGSTIEVSPTNTVTSDQQVNQAATAFGGK